MTPALLSALTSSSPPLPITWRTREAFTAEHIEALLVSLRAGCAPGYAARVACDGALTHGNADAAAALAAACAACPALRAEVEAAEAEGRARLRASEADLVAVDRRDTIGDAVDRDRIGAETAPEVSSKTSRVVGVRNDDAGGHALHVDARAGGRGDARGVHVVGADPPAWDVANGAAAEVEMHAQQGATAEAHAQEKKRSDGDVQAGSHVMGGWVSGAGHHAGGGASDLGEPLRVRNAIRRGDTSGGVGASTVHGAEAGSAQNDPERDRGGERAGDTAERDAATALAAALTDEGPGALRAPEPISASPVAHHHTLAANGSQPPGTSLAQSTAAPAVAQAPAWRDAVARSAALDAEAAPKPAAEPAGAYGLDLGKLAARAAALAGPALPISFGYLLLVDEACRRAGIPAMSLWWRWVLGRFHASLKRWGVFLVGRGGGKSTNLEKECASAVLFTPRHVFPGQTWTAPFISVGPDDANRRIFEIQAVLAANAVEVKPVTSPRAKITMTDVRGNAVEIGSLASTIGNMSGPSLVALLIDEAGKLVNKDGADRSANPLREIIISAASAFRARQGPRAIICSSAWECSGAHFELVEQGDNETNFLATIGEDFLEDARRGFDLVAQWEERGNSVNRRAPDLVAAAAIRAHAASLTAASPNVPTWVANPTLGNPEVGEPWEGAAVASRIEVQAIPEKKILAEGMPRWMFWLRECGSKPINRAGGKSGAGAWCEGMAERNRKLNARETGERTLGTGEASTRRGERRATGGGRRL